MVKELVVGLVLIAYVYSSIACFILTRELVLDVCVAAIPKLEEDFMEYTRKLNSMQLKLTFAVLVVSIIPVANLYIAACIYYHYDRIRAEMVEEFKKDPHWDKIQEDYNLVMDVIENESRNDNGD